MPNVSPVRHDGAIRRPTLTRTPGGLPDDAHAFRGSSLDMAPSISLDASPRRVIMSAQVGHVPVRGADRDLLDWFGNRTNSAGAVRLGEDRLVPNQANRLPCRHHRVETVPSLTGHPSQYWLTRFPVTAIVRSRWSSIRRRGASITFSARAMNCSSSTRARSSTTLVKTSPTARSCPAVRWTPGHSSAAPDPSAGRW